jgi:glycosyltransferase involved in cell wall biosynthesis
MPDPVLTIITPSLNHGRFIGVAVDSACPRTDIPFEHLVIDAASTDETAAVLAARPRLDVHLMPNLDSHEALNYALTKAKGEIIGFLNSDDRYEDGALDAVMAHFRRNADVQALCGTMRFFNDTDGVEREIGIFPHHKGDDFRLELTFGNPGFNSWFFRRQLLHRLNGFRTYYRFAADRDLLLRLYGQTIPAVFDPLVYHYREHTGSRTMDPRGTNRQAMIMDHLRLVREQSADIWPGDPLMLDLLANWEALEKFKLFVRACRYQQSSVWPTLIGTPWHRVPTALALRRRWLRISQGGAA